MLAAAYPSPAVQRRSYPTDSSAKRHEVTSELCPSKVWSGDDMELRHGLYMVVSLNTKAWDGGVNRAGVGTMFRTLQNDPRASHQISASMVENQPTPSARDYLSHVASYFQHATCRSHMLHWALCRILWVIRCYDACTWCELISLRSPFGLCTRGFCRSNPCNV